VSESANGFSKTATFARELIRFDTSNWGNGVANSETESAEYVAAELTKLGLKPEFYEAAPGRTSVVTRIPGANPDLPMLVVHGHLDVVPVDEKQWSVEPFAGDIKDGVLFGRGAVDMKGMDAMILSSLGEILRSGRLPNRELIVAYFADEENGGWFGSHHLVDNHPELFDGASEAISEVGGYSVTIAGKRAYLLQTGEKALIWAKLIARGDAAHGSRVIKNNAITKLAEAIVKLGEEEWPITLTDTTTALIAELAKIQQIDANSDPRQIVRKTGLAAGFLEPALSTTANPTQLDSGYKHNVIPDTATAAIDIRPLPGEEKKVLARIREIIGPEIEIEIISEDIGLENPLSSPIVEQMAASLDKGDPGAKMLPYLLSGGTDNKALAKLGIAGYGFAPLLLPPDLDFPSLFHGVDERVPVSALDFGHLVLTDFLLNY
jgi:acetylornithine deacetylase/succinyl-diaminopimelate desuccinylase-like protein